MGGDLVGHGSQRWSGKDGREELNLEHDSPKNNSVPKHNVVLWRRSAHTGGRIFLKSGGDGGKETLCYSGKGGMFGGESKKNKQTDKGYQKITQATLSVGRKWRQQTTDREGERQSVGFNEHFHCKTMISHNTICRTAVTSADSRAAQHLTAHFPSRCLTPGTASQQL